MLRSRRAAFGAAFTIIELLVVISIILILTTLLVMGLSGAKKKAQVKASRALVEQIKTALDSYFAAFREYPPDGYDDDDWGGVPGFAGVNVGFPGRPVKGTSSLIYFLCRPVVQVSYRGPSSDPRNQVRQKVGPFLTSLRAMNYTREGFDPNHTWSDNNYWGTTGAQKGYILTEIVDAFHRPLCYDRVPSFPPTGDPNHHKYFQPWRFHNISSTATAGSSNADSKGRFVHPDQDFINTKVLPLDDQEMVCPTQTHDTNFLSLTTAQQLGIHTDPRYARLNRTGPGGDGCAFASLGGTAAGDDSSHEPRNVGGYDLWSMGPSYINALDDLGSWE